MPTKKKTATDATLEATKPAAAKAPAKAKRVAAPKPAAAKAKAEKTAAATHKSPARKSPAKPAPAAEFNIDLHRAEIEQEAYFLFANRGYTHGDAHGDWLRAIEIVRARYSTQAA
jgi:BRCT domain type II-containing protein